MSDDTRFPLFHELKEEEKLPYVIALCKDIGRRWKLCMEERDRLRTDLENVRSCLLSHSFPCPACLKIIHGSLGREP